MSIKIDLEFETKLDSDLLSVGVSGKLAEVVMVFMDKKGLSPPISLKAFLVDSDTVPLIIGFEDILTDIKIVSDYRTKIAFSQFPSPL